MSCLTPGTFLLIWIGFLLLMIIALGAVFAWAIRTRQFSNQDRARYLPLESGIPEEADSQAKDLRPDPPRSTANHKAWRGIEKKVVGMK